MTFCTLPSLSRFHQLFDDRTRRCSQAQVQNKLAKIHMFPHPIELCHFWNWMIQRLLTDLSSLPSFTVVMAVGPRGPPVGPSRAAVWLTEFVQTWIQPHPLHTLFPILFCSSPNFALCPNCLPWNQKGDCWARWSRLTVSERADKHKGFQFKKL